MLHRYELKYDKSKADWILKDQEGGVVRRFARKGDALERSGLKTLLGEAGGTVRIHIKSGQFEEERTFPRAADPRGHPG